VSNGNPKTVPDAIAELKLELNQLKEEVKEFVSTRVAMLRAEMGEKLQSVKAAAPMMVVGLLLLITAWLAFTGFLVCIIAQAFPIGQWAYVVSFIIVALIYGAAGGATALFAWKQIKQMGVKPKRTMQVLEQDRIWLQTEARTQL
jgi:Putative Actinobacterial Holin-X, holin superfamily III